jgi:hypothetical protein
MSIIKVENLSKRYIIGHDRNAGKALPLIATNITLMIQDLK